MAPTRHNLIFTTVSSGCKYNVMALVLYWGVGVGSGRDSPISSQLCGDPNIADTLADIDQLYGSWIRIDTNFYKINYNITLSSKSRPTQRSLSRNLTCKNFQRTLNFYHSDYETCPF